LIQRLIEELGHKQHKVVASKNLTKIMRKLVSIESLYGFDPNLKNK